MFSSLSKGKVTNNQGIMKRSIYLLFGVIFLLSSCYEEPLTKALITVYNTQGEVVSGAEVTLSQDDMGPGVNQTNIIDVKTSDVLGQTEHVFELESIMNVDAILYGSAGDTIQSGHTIIRLTRGKTEHKDIEISPN